LGLGGLLAIVALLIGGVAWALLSAAWHLPGSARLSADPNPVPAGPELGSTMISWQGPAGAFAQVYVSVDGEPEQLLAQGPSGSAEAPWIATDREYEFRLYAGTDHRSRLSTVRVSRASAGPGAESFPWPGVLALWLVALALAGWAWSRSP